MRLFLKTDKNQGYYPAINKLEYHRSEGEQPYLIISQYRVGITKIKMNDIVDLQLEYRRNR